MMIAISTLVLALTALLPQERVTVSAATGMASVRELYAAASFEEALTRLAAIEEHVAIEQAEQYRALCLLGLGRASEAQQSLERMVVANPLYTIPDAEFSPRLISMFREVRKRLLPAAARDLYLEAKTNFDGKRYGPAALQFRELLAVLGDSDMAEQADGLRDLRLLGEGFLKLADGELAAAKRASEPATAAAAVRPPEAPRAIPIYSDGEAGVVAAVELERRLPAWNPPAAIARIEYRGLLEVVINERGLVESAILRRPVAPSYDRPLIDSVKFWRFQPATREGVPVKFRKTFEIVLSKR
jgi:TonB family protein